MFWCILAETDASLKEKNELFVRNSPTDIWPLRKYLFRSVLPAAEALKSMLGVDRKVTG